MVKNRKKYSKIISKTMWPLYCTKIILVLTNKILFGYCSSNLVLMATEVIIELQWEICLGGLSLPRKSVVRLTDRPDMTLDAYRGRKTTKQSNNGKFKKKTHFCIVSADILTKHLKIHF